jgi:hypothetical protein
MRFGRAASTWALVLVLDLVAFVPRLVFPNPAAGSILLHPKDRPGTPGIAYELGLLLCLLALTAHHRWRRVFQTAAVLLFAAFLLFSTYHEAYLHAFYIDPAVVDDWRLLLGLGHFLRDASSGWWLAIAAALLAYALAIALAVFTFGRFQAWAAAIPLRTRAIGVAAWALAGGAVVATVRHPPTNALVQPISDGIFVNVSASRSAIANRHAVFDAAPDTRYDGLAALPMARRPNVYVMFFEAYGELLATCSSQTAYRDLLGRLEQRFTQSGFHMRSGYSTAPIYGGRSWLSIGTLQTGIRIDSPSTYRVLEQSAPRVPTLTRFFQAHGYRTLMLQPWDQPRFGLPFDDIFQRDVTVVRKDLPYHGGKYGVAEVPDQYSLGYFQEHFLSSAPQPRFVFYMATSTHYNWWSAPPLMRDWKEMDGVPPPAHVIPFAPLAGEAAITDAEYQRYFADVVYEWRVLADFIEARRDEDALVIVLGDHQPLLHCDATETFNTPVHVIARDPSLVDAFADVGLEKGLYVPPGAHPPLRHEGFFSLLVSKLTGIARYFPSGIGPSGLRR